MVGSTEAFSAVTARGLIDADYLASALGISVRTARNLLPNLRRLGLVDDGHATDLTASWRDDEQYHDACLPMIERAYQSHNDPARRSGKNSTAGWNAGGRTRADSAANDTWLSKSRAGQRSH
jgi:hypothetical protein